MILNKIEDPRSNLQKAKRRELVDFALKNGVTQISGFPVNDGTPADILRAELRQRGLTRIDIPLRVLGAQNQPGTGLKYQNRMQAPGGTVAPTGVTVDAGADMRRQFEAEQTRHAAETKWRAELAAMGINELGAEMKRLKIHRDRKDNKETMRAKITAHRESHG